MNVDDVGNVTREEASEMLSSYFVPHARCIPLAQTVLALFRENDRLATALSDINKSATNAESPVKTPEQIQELLRVVTAMRSSYEDLALFVNAGSKPLEKCVRLVMDEGEDSRTLSVPQHEWQAEVLAFQGDHLRAHKSAVGAAVLSAVEFGVCEVVPAGYKTRLELLRELVATQKDLSALRAKLEAE